MRFIFAHAFLPELGQRTICCKLALKMFALCNQLSSHISTQIMSTPGLPHQALGNIARIITAHLFPNSAQCY